MPYEDNEVHEDDETGEVGDDFGEPVFRYPGGGWSTWDELPEAAQSYYKMVNAGKNVTGIDLEDYCDNADRLDGAIDDDDLDEPGAAGAQLRDQD